LEVFKSFHSFGTMEIAQRILLTAENLFKRYGVKSITMDDIARKIAISKKTIYQSFRDKDSLILEVTKSHLVRDEQALEEIHAASLDPIDEVLKISDYIRKHLETVNTAILFEIEKYYPKSFDLIHKHHEARVYDMLIHNMKKGKELGLYRQEINVEILARLRIEQIRISCNPELFPGNKYAASLVHHQFFSHFIFGICTLKGHKLINKYKQIEEDLMEEDLK
jgi:AcrR family transcriptional regulator